MDPTGAANPGGIITAKNVDLTTCDRELVQYPEAIQPHGVMLTVDDQSNRIVHASANCAELLGAQPEAIIGKGAASVLGAAGRDLVGVLHRIALEAGPMHVARELFVGSDRGFNLFAHRSGGLDRARTGEGGGARPRSLAEALCGAEGRHREAAGDQERQGEFFDLAVSRIRSFTGFDRVMAYRFDEDGSGHVIAEDKRDELEPYLGLHYPATDIPAPARRMFSMAWVRHLPDVDYVPVPLVSAKRLRIAGPVDMSYREPAKRFGHVLRLSQEHGREGDARHAADEGGQALGPDLGDAPRRARAASPTKRGWRRSSSLIRSRS